MTTSEAIGTLERLARDNRALVKRESESIAPIEGMRLYYLGKAQAYEIAANLLRESVHYYSADCPECEELFR